ncbi:branched-chain amino acid ABC transporter permease [Bradyrhizobium sp. dw_78]|uniref:branched-chain amino acid ABC transporter permease n=1 Tax=Bradyrhizobium sp. dw_78 TaxID=2719793 RepID=UPI001BD2CA75|nr:branched-chain amino acid ABC transporter permease [Bradyrhizobium sp. dw_78]
MGQLIVNGLALGSIYALVALGLLMIFNTVQIVNFAQGQLLMLGAFIGISSAVTQELPIAIAWIVTMAAMALIGIVFMVLVYLPLRGRSPFLVILTTISMGIVLENLALIIWGPLPVSLPSPVHGAPLRFAGVVISMHQAFTFATLIVVLTLQFLLLTRTRFGILMQATAQDLRTARLVGIPVQRTIAVAFASGAVLSGIAGLLVAPTYLAEPTMGGSLGLKAFVVSVIGGFGSLPGAVIGGLSLGLIETFGARYISSNFRDAYAFIIMIGVLIAWPRGLFGEKTSEKV